MSIRNARKPDSEWLAIITEARQSGLTDKQWCEEHNISKNTFYTAVDRLRKKACNIPEPQHNKDVFDLTNQKQDVVQIGIERAAVPEVVANPIVQKENSAAIEISLSGASIKISDSASPALVSALMTSMGGLI